MGDERPLIGVDATPLWTGHAIRGIGRYLTGMLEAVRVAEPDWSVRAIGVLLARDQPTPYELERTWRTWRSSWRPQDVDPIVARLADRVAIRHGRPRLWHHTDPAIPATPLGAARTIVTVYDLIPLQVPEVMARIRPHRRIAYRRYLDLVRSARGVIAISQTTSETLIRLLGVDPARVRVVPPSIHRKTVETSGQSGPATSAATDSYLFVGVPDAHKRPGLAIDSVAELVRRGHDPALTMVGAHPAWIRQQLRDRARRAGVAERVRFLDRIDDERLDALYRGSITLALSTVEGFGLPPVEAVIAGGRVVATPIEAYREGLGGHATFASDATPAAIADAVSLSRTLPVSPPTDLVARHAPATVGAALRRAYEELSAN